MKVLWFNHRDSLHSRAGGAERTILELSKKFDRIGIQITLVTGGTRKGEPVSKLENLDINRFRGNMGPHFAHPHFLKGDYDVVVDDLAHVVPWFSETVGSIPGTVFFRHLHARSLKGQVSRPLELSLGLIERNYGKIYKTWPFVTESNTGVSDLEKIGINQQRVVQIEPGVDTDKFRPGEKTDFPSIVFIGRMMEYKRPDHAVIAMKGVISHFPDAKLFVIGDGPFLDYVRNLVSSLKLGSNVEILGKVSDQELVRVLSASWVNIHTSITEGWGYSIMEASACGVPTVAYKVPGVVDAIDPSKNGYLVQDGDVGELGKAIISQLSSPESMVASSRHYAELHTWEKSAIKWSQHLNNVASGMYR